ncbi:BRO family protein [Amycolatopsis japonica]
MNDLIPFESGSYQIRVILRDGEPWFVAADVCKVLDVRDTHDLTRNLDDDEKGTDSIRTPGGPQDVTVISEAGLYSAILRSRKPAAKDFKRWITHEVIPSIRKTGGYLANPEGLDELEVAEKYVAALKAKRELESQLAIAGPKAEYVDAFVNGEKDATILRVVANQIQIGEKELRSVLMDRKAIYQKLEGRRFSRSKGRMVAEYSWHAYASHRSWFVERDQPEAPRYHNGQMRTTLYVTPIGKVKIADLLRKSA